MKNIIKILTITISSIVLILIIFGSTILFESRSYFIEYFNIQKKKLNLRKEESVDSLQNVILSKTKIIDSLTVVNKQTEKQLNDEIKINKSLTKIILKTK
jgi:hypothetical protein